MSISVRKVTITTAETNKALARNLVLHRLGIYMATLPGCRITNSDEVGILGYGFFINLNVTNGLTDQISLTALGGGGSNVGTPSFGVCENGYSPDIATTTLYEPTFYYYFANTRESVFSYHDFYLFFENNRLICLSDTIMGYVIFKEDHGILKTILQTQAITPNWYDNNSSYSCTVNPNMDGVDICTSHENGHVYYIGGTPRITSLSPTVMALPTGKILKFSRPIMNESLAIVSEETEYPVHMTGDMLMFAISSNYGDNDMAATHMKIQVGGKNYMHIGGVCWMPYDSITTTTISAD